MHRLAVSYTAKDLDRMKLKLNVQLGITEVDDEGRWYNNNRFNLADDIDLGVMNLREALALMAYLHDSLKNNQKMEAVKPHFAGGSSDYLENGEPRCQSTAWISATGKWSQCPLGADHRDVGCMF